MSSEKPEENAGSWGVKHFIPGLLFFYFFIICFRSYLIVVQFLSGEGFCSTNRIYSAILSERHKWSQLTRQNFLSQLYFWYLAKEAR